MILSDCGHSSNYTPLLDRVKARIEQWERANSAPTPPAAQPALDIRQHYKDGWAAGFDAAQRQWVGLPDDEIEEMANDFEEGYVFLYRSFARAIEAKLKEKNNG
jgi:hypothetical protein